MKIDKLYFKTTGILARALREAYEQKKISEIAYSNAHFLLQKFIKLDEVLNLSTNEEFEYIVEFKESEDK